MEDLYRFLLDLGVEPEKAKKNVNTLRWVIHGIINKRLRERSPINLSATSSGLVATYGSLKVSFDEDGIFVSPVEGCSCWKEDEIKYYRYRDERENEVHSVRIPQPPHETIDDQTHKES